MIGAKLMAAVVICLVAGIALGAAVAGGVSALFFPLSGVRIDTTAGRELFESQCSGCHAVTPGRSGGLGPSLARIGAEGHEKRAGMGAEEYVLESIQYPDAHREPSVEGQMPRGTAQNASEEDIRNLVAYVVSLSARPDFEALLGLSIDTDALEAEASAPTTLAEVRHGFELFSKTLGCAGCHSILGEPGGNLRAPSLTRASQLSVAYILSSIRRPSEYISKGYRRVSVTLDDGSTVEGQLFHDGPDRVEVLVEDRMRRLEKFEFAKDDIRSVKIDPKSPMPAYDLSPSDERDLTAFLKFLSAST